MALGLIFCLRDHLGSLTAVLDKTGNVLEKLSYDAWGKRRNLNGSGINLSVLYAFKPQFSERGYTAHKHIDSMGLIHMNGRVYDPVIARFLSADPIIQAPSNLQSLNRYSYVINNPLSYTDPSGYGWKGWKKLRGVLKVAVGIAIVAVGVVMTPLNPVLGPFISSLGVPLIQSGVNDLNGKPSTQNVSWNSPRVEASFDYPSSGTNPKPSQQSYYNQPSNTGSGTGTVGSPGVTSSPSALAQYGIAGTCAHPRDCGVTYSNDFGSNDRLTQAQINKMTPFDVVMYWAQGNGGYLYFDSDSEMSKTFSQSSGAKLFESNVYDKYNGNPKNGDSMDQFAYTFTWPRAAQALKAFNLAEQAVGSWSSGVALVTDKEIQFRVSNTMGANSLFFGRQLGEKGITPVGHSDGDLHMVIEWNSPLRKKE